MKAQLLLTHRLKVKQILVTMDMHNMEFIVKKKQEYLVPVNIQQMQVH